MSFVCILMMMVYILMMMVLLLLILPLLLLLRTDVVLGPSTVSNERLLPFTSCMLFLVGVVDVDVDNSNKDIDDDLNVVANEEEECKKDTLDNKDAFLIDAGSSALFVSNDKSDKDSLLESFSV